MTTLVPARSHNQNPPPAPLDQPTPQSPPFMSTNHAPPDMTSDKHHPNSSSPASFNNHSQQPRVTNHNPNSLLTPASSIAPNSTHEDTEGDVVMEDGISYANNGPNKRRRTSVDSSRQTGPPNLRNGSESRGTALSTPSLPNLEELLANPDVSPYYLVCEKPHKKAYPELSEDLISLYGLQPIADKVARFTSSGAKNKLRKSYKGFISNVAGKNDIVAQSSNDLNMMDDFDKDRYHLTYITKWPEEDWKAQNVYGKEIGKSFDLSKLKRGLAGMTKGDVPGFDASILGLDDEPPRKVPHAASPPAAVGTPRMNGAGSTPGNLSTGPAGPHGDDMRPQRKKRRRYHDGSYEGYEGYEDDEPETGGNRTGNIPNGDGAWKQKQKKRKKNPDVNSPGGMNLPHHDISMQQPNMLYGR